MVWLLPISRFHPFHPKEGKVFDEGVGLAFQCIFKAHPLIWRTSSGNARLIYARRTVWSDTDAPRARIRCSGIQTDRHICCPFIKLSKRSRPPLLASTVKLPSINGEIYPHPKSSLRNDRAKGFKSYAFHEAPEIGCPAADVKPTIFSACRCPIDLKWLIGSWWPEIPDRTQVLLLKLSSYLCSEEQETH